MTLRGVVTVAILAFPISELALAGMTRARSSLVKGADQGSLGFLWLAISISVTLAMFLPAWTRAGLLPLPPGLRDALALFFLLGGLLLRWASILTLGRFFTVNVAIQEGHAVVDRGPYRYVRHPSYTGLLMAFLGLGFSTGNGISVVVMMIPIGLALLYRIRTEERALLLALGPAYETYCAKTQRLLPGIY